MDDLLHSQHVISAYKDANQTVDELLDISDLHYLLSENICWIHWKLCIIGCCSQRLNCFQTIAAGFSRLLILCVDKQFHHKVH